MLVTRGPVARTSRLLCDNVCDLQLDFKLKFPIRKSSSISKTRVRQRLKYRMVDVDHQR